jgi:glycine betaine transporter
LGSAPPPSNAPTPPEPDTTPEPRRRLNLFHVALPICAVVGVGGIAFPESLASGAGAITGVTFEALDWYYMSVVSACVIVAGWLAFGRYGTLRLGGPDEQPEFSYAAWLSMLFAAGMGVGLLFWGVAEPMMHFASPPSGVGGSPEAARRAMVLTNMHWGLQAWSIYAMGALVLGYFAFRRGTPYLPGAPIRDVFRGRWVEPVARVADLVAVLAVAFGVAGSIAMGVLQFHTGLSVVTDVPAQSMTVRVVLLVVLFISYMTSAATSLDKGIKWLSQINITLALLLMFFVLMAGPTADLMRGFVTALGDYLTELPGLALTTYPYVDKSGWFHGWTLVYFVWWIAWTPFVGIFIARISRGRTVREFLVCVVLVPTLFSILWFAIFGGTAFHEEMLHGGVAQLVNENVTVALFSLFERLPMSSMLSWISLMLVFVFLVTSVDSATYVLGMLTSRGSMDPPVSRKLGWGISLAILGGALMVAERIDVVRAVSILGALPFTLVLLLQIGALLKAMRRDAVNGEGNR